MRFYQSISILDYSFSVKFNTYKVVSLSFLIVKTPNKETVGMTSRCKDGKHVLFFDFDGLTIQEVIEEIYFMMGRYELSDFYLFENDLDDSFHAVCLNKFSLSDAMEIIGNSSADRGFKNAPYLFKRRRWVLRVAQKGDRDKPKFLKRIKSENWLGDISTAHRLFLNAHYSLKIKPYKFEDGFKEDINLCAYNTGANC